MDGKLSLVSTNEEMIDFINKENNKTREEMTKRMDQDGKAFNERFDKLIMEELTHELGYFGKEGSIVRPYQPGNEAEG